MCSYISTRTRRQSQPFAGKNRDVTFTSSVSARKFKKPHGNLANERIRGASSPAFFFLCFLLLIIIRWCPCLLLLPASRSLPQHSFGTAAREAVHSSSLLYILIMSDEITDVNNTDINNISREPNFSVDLFKTVLTPRIVSCWLY